MAVFTPVTLAEAREFCSAYALPAAVRACTPIAEGTDNSNFIIETDDTARYILTIFESRIDPAHLPAIFDFVTASAVVIKTPQALTAENGETLLTLKGKPAILVEFIRGRAVKNPQPAHCRAVGDILAQLHLNSEKIKISLPENALSLKAWRRLYDESLDKITDYDAGIAAEIGSLLGKLVLDWPRIDDLPHGAVHADLFPDNVFFDGDRPSGVIDFYFACDDFFAYDLMLTLNAWCFDSATGAAKPDNIKAFLEAYQNRRPLTSVEISHITTLGIGAALRIALTRLRDFGQSGDDMLFMPHDPKPYLNIIQFYQSGDMKAFIR